MSVYEEGNLKNGMEFWPDLSVNEQILNAENDIYQYLSEIFFAQTDAVYCILCEDGEYRSALRLEPYQDGLLLEALETSPDHRRKGYARSLLRAVLDMPLEKKIYSHVSKNNVPSLKVHEKCGFRRILDHAVYVDGSVNQNCVTLLYQK